MHIIRDRLSVKGIRDKNKNLVCIPLFAFKVKALRCNNYFCSFFVSPILNEIQWNKTAQIPTVNNRTFLYFNINGDGPDEVITVEGGGVNATILQADVASTNGYVHIIDKVLGVPYMTVLGKLESDPMLR